LQFKLLRGRWRLGEMTTSSAPLSGLFTLQSSFIKSFGESLLVIGKCVRFGCDGTDNGVCVWTLKNLLAKDLSSIAWPPFLSESVTHFSKNGGTVLRTKNMRGFHGDPT
jgi:hypothetical protein